MRHEFESLNAQTVKQSMKVNSRRNALTRKQRAGDGQHSPPHFNNDIWRKVQGDLVQRVILSKVLQEGMVHVCHFTVQEVA